MEYSTGSQLPRNSCFNEKHASMLAANGTARRLLKTRDARIILTLTRRACGSRLKLLATPYTVRWRRRRRLALALAYCGHHNWRPQQVPIHFSPLAGWKEDRQVQKQTLSRALSLRGGGLAHAGRPMARTEALIASETHLFTSRLTMISTVLVNPACLRLRTSLARFKITDPSFAPLWLASTVTQSQLFDC